ncbi:MAG: membrane protein insertase YidC [Bacteroidales bacterium]|nr:membrane protein insertase YidC [Bacteroidales bacterium]
MDKNTILGFVLIGIILVGFTWYQSRQFKKQAAEQAAEDERVRLEMAEARRADSLYKAEHPELFEEAAPSFEDGYAAGLAAAGRVNGRNSYKDTLLNVSADAEAAYYTLENDKIEICFTTRGAQPYSVRIKDYQTYDSTALYFMKPGFSELGISVYVGEYVNTKDFTFQLAELTENSISMRLPFDGGGFIQQKFTLEEASCMVQNELSFVGMDSLIPRNVSSMDIDWNMTIPRFEKGFRNEAMYSQLDYRFPDERKVAHIGRSRDGSKRLNVNIAWFAFQQQFFSAIYRPLNTSFSSGDFALKFADKDDPERNLMACAARMTLPMEVRSQEETIPFEFYFGPNHFKTLRSYKQRYEGIIPLGGWLIAWINRIAIIPCFNFFGRFISNYGIVILIMTLLLKIILAPFSYRSYASSAKMQAVKPLINEINAKYPKQEDAMKKQQATMDLYKRAGISPMGGCLPMLFQFPILFAMFRFFPASIELRQQHFLWASDLSAYDSILDLPFNIPLYGDHISLFALLMAISMWLYSKMNSSQMSDDPNMAGMKFMSVWLMPIMMLFICNNLSSGLSYYYLLSNLITMLQTWLIRKYAINADEILAKVKASEGKPVPKSKWQQRLEQAQQMQAQMAKDQAKKAMRK